MLLVVMRASVSCRPPPVCAPSAPPLCGCWSEVKSNLLEHRYLGDNFNMRPDMTDTQRLMLAWPLVHATLGMPTRISSGSLRKPVVTEKQPEEEEE